MLPVTFGIHKTFLVASTLAARLGPKPIYRNAKCRGGAESSAQAKPSADVPWCREGAHAKRPNSSRIRAHAKQNAPMRSFRKPRTAASFVPKACKTQASKNAKNTSQKKCFPSPLESIKHFLWPAPSLRGWVRNQYTATPNAVEEPKVVPKPNRPQTVKEPMRNARTAAGFEPTPSKMPLCEASESLERQQASCPRHAKHKPAKMLPVTFGIHKTCLAE